MSERRSDPDLMGGLAKGLAVIEAFSAERPRLAIADVARVTSLERATARRCLLTLVRSGYAEFDGKYFSLTPRVLRLGMAYFASASLPTILAPLLDRVAATTGESCSATVLDGRDIVYVARASQKRVMSIGLGIGSRLPAFCTSMGRVLLAALPPDEARALTEASDRRPRTAKTLTDVDDILDRLESVRRDGYCLVDEELEVGLRSLAVPVLSAGGRVVAAMNVGAQSQQVSTETMVAVILPQLLAAQAELRRMIA